MVVYVGGPTYIIRLRRVKVSLSCFFWDGWMSRLGSPIWKEFLDEAGWAREILVRADNVWKLRVYEWSCRRIAEWRFRVVTEAKGKGHIQKPCPRSRLSVLAGHKLIFLHLDPQ